MFVTLCLALSLLPAAALAAGDPLKTLYVADVMGAAVAFALDAVLTALIARLDGL